MHQLLPWFVADTLEPADKQAFSEHLSSCETCREEMVFLESVRDGVASHGAHYISEHPSAERLVAYLRGELDEIAARGVQGHLVQCPTCTLESHWATQEAPVSDEQPVTPATRLPRWSWAAAAAILLLGITPWLIRPTPSAEIPQLRFLAAGERGGDTESIRRVAGHSLTLMIEPELSPDSYPVEVELIDSDGRLIRRYREVPHGVLESGRYLVIPCPRKACTAGDYKLKITPSQGSEPPLERRFSIE